MLCVTCINSTYERELPHQYSAFFFINIRLLISCDTDIHTIMFDTTYIEESFCSFRILLFLLLLETALRMRMEHVHFAFYESFHQENMSMKKILSQTKFCLFVCSNRCFTSQSTTMAMSGRCLHLYKVNKGMLFFIFTRNTDCWYSLDSPRQGGSNV